MVQIDCIMHFNNLIRYQLIFVTKNNKKMLQIFNYKTRIWRAGRVKEQMSKIHCINISDCSIFKRGFVRNLRIWVQNLYLQWWCRQRLFEQRPQYEVKWALFKWGLSLCKSATMPLPTRYILLTTIKILQIRYLYGHQNYQT